MEQVQHGGKPAWDGALPFPRGASPHWEQHLIPLPRYAMASHLQRLPANRPGPFYVDSRCIDCGTCWQFDPLHFAPAGSSACVQRQPVGEDETRLALLALQACPVAAINTGSEERRAMPRGGFPVLVTRHPAGDVYYCGWASRRSFGASSWLVVRPEGNVLVDSPRWSAPLAQRFQALGGLAAIVLTRSGHRAGFTLPMPMRRQRPNSALRGWSRRR